MSIAQKAVDLGVKLIVEVVMALVDKALKGASRDDIEFEARLRAHRLLVKHSGNLILAAKSAVKKQVKGR